MNSDASSKQKGWQGLIQKEVEEDSHQGGTKQNGWHLFLLEDCIRAERYFMLVVSYLYEYFVYLF